MRKLNKRKIRWIIKHWGLGKLSVWRIARLQGVTPRWVRMLYEGWQETGEYPFPGKPGRKSKPLTEEEVELVKKTRKEHSCGAVNLEKILTDEEKHMPHNRIHRILLQEKLAKREPKKSKRRRYARYERRHSNSLWHVDYSKIDGQWFIAFEDDASRLITGWGAFNEATAEHAVEVLEEGIGVYGVPKANVNDHGTQFVSLKRKTCQQPADNFFQQTLKQYGIRQIKTRVNHPQANGKLERWWQTNSFLTKHFGNLHKAIQYYNEQRPHLSLENGSLRTPIQAS